MQYVTDCRVKAVDEWNSSTGNYADFISHMHKAWLYLLHAEFRHDRVDYFYHGDSGKIITTDGRLIKNPDQSEYLA